MIERPTLISVRRYLIIAPRKQGRRRQLTTLKNSNSLREFGESLNSVSSITRQARAQTQTGNTQGSNPSTVHTQPTQAHGETDTHAQTQGGKGAGSEVGLSLCLRACLRILACESACPFRVRALARARACASAPFRMCAQRRNVVRSHAFLLS